MVSPDRQRSLLGPIFIDWLTPCLNSLRHSKSSRRWPNMQLDFSSRISDERSPATHVLHISMRTFPTVQHRVHSEPHELTPNRGRRTGATVR